MQCLAHACGSGKVHNCFRVELCHRGVFGEIVSCGITSYVSPAVHALIVVTMEGVRGVRGFETSEKKVLQGLQGV